MFLHLSVLLYLFSRENTTKGPPYWNFLVKMLCQSCFLLPSKSLKDVNAVESISISINLIVCNHE